MVIEIYRKKTELEPIQPEEKSLELYKSLGFKGLETLAALPDPADWYPELTRKQLLTWASFLPTPYFNQPPNRPVFFRGDRWCHYCFDKVPVPIMKELETAQNLGFFKFIAIFTPEKNQSDPVAIGYYEMPDGNFRHFLLCRWGESLIPYWQVWARVHPDTCFFAALLTAAITILVVESLALLLS